MFSAEKGMLRRANYSRVPVNLGEGLVKFKVGGNWVKIRGRYTFIVTEDISRHQIFTRVRRRLTHANEKRFPPCVLTRHWYPFSTLVVVFTCSFLTCLFKMEMAYSKTNFIKFVCETPEKSGLGFNRVKFCFFFVSIFPNFSGKYEIFGFIAIWRFLRSLNEKKLL